jgi:hypothetical protein
MTIEAPIETTRVIGKLMTRYPDLRFLDATAPHLLGCAPVPLGWFLGVKTASGRCSPFLGESWNHLQRSMN